jgi:hypothetical protein
MITLKLNKIHDFKVGEEVHFRVKSIYEMTPGKWKLEVEDITHLPGAEPLGYACHFCGLIEPAKEDGSLPEGWKQIKYEQGSFFGCPDCQDVQLCRVCGCSQEAPCDDGCYWVEGDLCSACEGKKK